MKVSITEKRPIKMWLDDLEPGAMKQAENLANLPFLHKHVAIMPDAHQGYGMPIGGVIATKGVIIPNAVGVDIGCGVCALRTSLKSISKNKLRKVIRMAKRKIPLGFKHHNQAQDRAWMPTLGNKQLPIVRSEYTHALHQLGTLGGGNHFIEFQKGSDGYIWVMIHSGSRNLGHKVATHYNKLAKEFSEKYPDVVPKSYDLAFLPLGYEAGQQYLEEMQFCMRFAMANRHKMMESIKLSLAGIAGSISFDQVINVPHNYAAFERHYGQKVVVHRKGATQAYKGQIGLIPGSQGTASYLVKGKGNEKSFMSCSHGAGRTMSRSKAKKILNFEEETKKLKGILHTMKNERQLDEAPGSYKDISVVMDNQKDLVEVMAEFKPLACIKG